MNYPSWFNSANLSELIKESRLRCKTNEEIENANNNIKAMIESLPSIKTADVDIRRSKVNIKERKGIQETSFGCDIENTLSVHAKTGYSNFFNRGETFAVSFKLSGPKNPKVNVSYTHPIHRLTDFRKANPFQILVSGFKVERPTVDDSPIQSIGAFSELSACKLPFSVRFSSTYKRIIKNERMPFPFKFDPHTYLWSTITVETPSHFSPFNYMSEIGIISKSLRDYIPFLRTRFFSKIPLPLGFSVYAAGGAILSQGPVPNNEKFRIGGVPIIRGSKDKQFGHSIGGHSVGSDIYLAGGLHQTQCILPGNNINAHFFINGAISKSLWGNDPLSHDLSFYKLITAGAGLILSQGPVKVELNVTHPLYNPSGIKTTSYGLGFAI